MEFDFLAQICVSTLTCGCLNVKIMKFTPHSWSGLNISDNVTNKITLCDALQMGMCPLVTAKCTGYSITHAMVAFEIKTNSGTNQREACLLYSLKS